MLGGKSSGGRIIVEQGKGKFMFKKSRLILLAVFSAIPLLLISCSEINYRYNNINFETPEAALAVQKDEIDSILAKINPTENPVGGTAIVILPSKEYIKKSFVGWNGPNPWPKPSQETIEKAYDYNATLLINGLQCVGRAIDKRHIFDNVVITQNDDPEKAVFSKDFAIILFKNKEGRAQWFVKRKKDIAGNFIPIEESSTILPPVQQMILRLDKIEYAARGSSKYLN